MNFSQRPPSTPTREYHNAAGATAGVGDQGPNRHGNPVSTPVGGARRAAEVPIHVVEPYPYAWPSGFDLYGNEITPCICRPPYPYTDGYGGVLHRAPCEADSNPPPVHT